MNNLNDSISPLHPEERRKWLEELTTHLPLELTAKFCSGEIEHGGDIGNVPASSLISEAKSEVLDLISYLAEIDRRMEDHHKLVLALAKVIMGWQQCKPILQEDKVMVQKLTEMLNLQGFQYPTPVHYAT